MSERKRGEQHPHANSSILLRALREYGFQKSRTKLNANSAWYNNSLNDIHPHMFAWANLNVITGMILVTR